MTASCPRTPELRQELAGRLRVLRHWPLGHHRLTRPTEPRVLAQCRASEASLSWLVRCTIAGYGNTTTQPAPEFAEVREASDSEDSFSAPTFESLSVVLARAEARGIDLERVSVHQETRQEPYEDWTDEYLVVCDEVCVGDTKYAAAIAEVWQDYQAHRLAEQQDRDDFATFLRLRARFGHLVDAKP